ncbi:cytochrome c-type biogenesis protein [Caulobacter sp. B11]|uniref:cytochrome c-type biogenesis protein n=1 Tax=Caulobacter sp. B11 TaxID=2048899 RepID=UPI0021014182|nr:cytochrome c-type biogenesis protein [Caulobacter sp. B11]
MAAASDPGERLADPAQEGRARELFREIRCLVCQNESIDDSQAELAQDLREIVRGQVAQGRSDAQISRLPGLSATANSCCCGRPSRPATRFCG